MLYTYWTFFVCTYKSLSRRDVRVGVHAVQAVPVNINTRAHIYIYIYIYAYAYCIYTGMLNKHNFLAAYLGLTRRQKVPEYKTDAHMFMCNCLPTHTV